MGDIVHAGASDIAAVQMLWREYWDGAGLAPEFQGFAAECGSLPGRYAPPEGRLLIALVEGQAAGTAAFRRLDARSCEAKRLYVRPEYRGLGLGRALLERLIEEARGAGYEEMCVDTLPSMASALEMYARMGFARVEAYSATPTPDAIFLKLSLLTPNRLGI